LKVSSGNTLYFQRSAETDFVFELIIRDMMRLLKADLGNIYHFDTDKKLIPYFEDRYNSEAFTVSQYCLEHHRTGFNFTPINPEIPETLIPLQHSHICVCLGDQDVLFGTFIVSKPKYFDHFFESDFSLMKNFAAKLSVLLKNSWKGNESDTIFINFRDTLHLLLENAQLTQNIKEFLQQLKTVLEISNMINSSREVSELIQSVLYSARKVMKAESASLCQLDEHTGELYFDVISEDQSTDLLGFRIPVGQGIVGIAAKEQKSVVVNDATNDPRIYRGVDELTRLVTRNLIASPLLINGQTIGVIEVINTIDRPTFSENDLELFESFSDSVAIAIQRRRLLDDLQRTNLQLERKLLEVTILHEVAALLVDVTTRDELFLKVQEIIIRDLKVSRTTILLYNNSTDKLEIVATAGIEIKNDSVDLEHTLAEMVIKQNTPLFIENIYDYPEYLKLTQPQQYESSSCILIPLSFSSSSRPFGILCVTDAPEKHLSNEDFQLLQTISSQVVRGYENILLSEEIIAKKAIEKELEITSKIQNNILPTQKLQHMHVDLASRSVMARTTGGDFYDYYMHAPNGDITLLVADVSGKSLPAALFMAVSSSILRTIIRSERNITKILSSANDLLYEESQSGMFVTVFIARYEPGSGYLRYSSAGHNEMLLLRKNGNYQLLSCRGTPLGTLPSFRVKYTGGEIPIEPEDILVLYTDGVIEALNAGMEEYGLDRLVQKVQENRNLSADEIIQKVYDDVIQFSGSELHYDDFTMLVTKFSGTIREPKTYTFSFPVRIASVPGIRNCALEIAQKHGLSGHKLEDILLAVDEAATNIITHAFKNEENRANTFDCEIYIESNNIMRITFIDNGIPFLIEEVKEPSIHDNLLGKRIGGFGVYLIRALMDRINYYRENGKNYLVIEKFLNK